VFFRAPPEEKTAALIVARHCRVMIDLLAALSPSSDKKGLVWLVPLREEEAALVVHHLL
jgi:hypothetical protein